MRYFKLMKENYIFGVINDCNFRRYQKKHEIVIFSEIESAEFVQYKDLFYRDHWLNPYPEEAKDKIVIDYIEINEIDQEQYNILEETLLTEGQIIEEEEYHEPQIVIQKAEEESQQTDVTLEYVRKVKIAQLQRDNKNKLQSGLDITLKDGTSQHYSIDTNGLLGLITVIVQSSSQESTYIINQINQFKNNCDQYCQSLIDQVNNLDNIKDINDIHYNNFEETQDKIE